jgi:predicted HTH transcriptional regulator
MNSEPDHAGKYLQQVLEAGRGTHLEWLDDSAPAASIAPVMAAMANSQGGMVIVGVAETLPSNKESSSKPHVTGVSDKTDTIDRILEATLSLDPPLIIPVI